MNKQNTKNKGFTLLEMLVVISIIGILAALSFVSFTSAQKQARDTKRKSDIKQYQTALESFATLNNDFYPSKTSSYDVSNLCATLGITGTCATDPKPDLYTYYYVSDGTGSGNTATVYVMWATMEASGNYMIVCSNGKTGVWASSPTSSVCPI